MRVKVKRSTGKKQQEEITKQENVIVTENNLFKGYTTEGVRNYYQKYSGKLDNSVTWNSSHCGKFLVGRFEAPSTIAVKLAGLFLLVIS